MTTGTVRKPSGRGCGRGVFALLTWEPLRRPGQPQKKTSQAQQPSNGDKFPVPPQRTYEDQVIKLISKHTFSANANSPGGFKEMSLKVGDVVEFIEPNKANPFWWNARKEDGETGFVPASYMTLLSDRPTTLPWLEANKKEETEVVAPVPNSKPYVSAYDKSSNGASSQGGPPKQYYCDVCEKDFNGPKPYSAHMVSKAHKDEVEVQKQLRS